MAISGSNSFGEAVVYYTEGTSFTNITYSPADYLYSYSPAPGFTAYVIRLSTPIHLGWNTALKSVTPNEMPIDLACSSTPLATNENSVAMNWTAVTGANIKYQREVTFPNSTISYFYNTPNYTPFSSFGGGAGTQGLWGTRVRAYTDLNGNNAIDAGENTSNWSNLCQIRYDNISPSVPVNGLPNATIIPTNNFDFTWDASSDASPINYKFQSSLNSAQVGGVLTTGLWTSTTLPSNMIHSSGAGNGTWYWQVKAIDSAGNESAWSTIWDVTLDTVFPIITISNPDTTPATSKTITASTNEGILSMFINPVGVTTCDESIVAFETYGSIDFSAETDNGKTVCYRAVDLAGNTTYLVSNPINGIDTTGPAAPTITAPTGNYYNTTPILNSWTAVSDLSGISLYRIEYAYDDGHTFSGAPYRTTTSTSRNHTPALTEQGGVQFRVQALDNAGNYGEWSTWKHYFYDATVPVVPTGLHFDNTARTQTYSCGSTIQSQAVIPDWDDVSGDASFSHYEYTSFWPDGHIGLNEQIISSSEFVNTWVAPADGAYGYAVRSVDLAGNKSAWALSAKTLAGSCYVVIDSIVPEITIYNPNALPALTKTLTASTEAGAELTMFTNPSGYNTCNAGLTFTSYLDSTFYTEAENGRTICYRAIDIAGNTTYKVSDPINGIDTTAPTIIQSDILIEATSASGVIVTFTPVVNDNFDTGLTANCTPISGSTFAIGSTTVNCSATDTAGNTISDSFVVAVSDTTAPTVPTNIHFNNPALTCGAYTNVGSNTVDWDDSSDAVGVTGYDYYIEYPLIGGGRGTWNTTTVASQRWGTLNPGLHELRVRAYDAAGNRSDWTSLCAITYDNQAPVITLLSDHPQYIELNTPYVELGATALDNIDGDISADINIISSSVFTSTTGTYSVTYTVTDRAGNSTTISRTVYVRDSIAPVTTDSGIDGEWHNTDVTVTLTCTDLNGIGCDKTYYRINGGVLIEHIYVDGEPTQFDISFSDDGIYNISYYSIDKAGNIEEETPAELSVKIDKTGPVITVPADFTLDATSPSGRENVTFIVTAEDAMTGSVPVDCTPVSGSTLSLGGHLITCTASDESGVPTSETLVVGTGTPTATPTETPIIGNTTTATFTITIVDTTAPIITLNGANPIYLAYGATYTEFGATASDIVDTDVPVTITGTVNTTVAGTYTITYSASDDSGNAATPENRTVIVAAQVIQPQVNNGNGGNVQGEATTPTPTVTPTEEVEDGRVLGLTDQKCDTKYESSGYVYVDSNNNGVKDDGEKMLNNVEVIIYLSKVKQDDGSYKDMDIVRVKTDDNGKWSTKVCEGDYKLTVDSNDLPSNTKNNTGSLDLKVKGASTNENFNIAIVETATAGFNWWILFIIGAVGGAIVYFVRRSSNKDQQLSYK
jgi:hypothetical protein